jgi:hypothetical protein
MHSTDLQLITNGSRPNALLVGSGAATLEALKEIQRSLGRPMCWWPRDGAPWTLTSEPKTLVLEDLAILGLGDQERLLAWLRQVGRAPQIVSISREPIHPFVTQGRFLGELYYRLNVVYVEC